MTDLVDFSFVRPQAGGATNYLQGYLQALGKHEAHRDVRVIVPGSAVDGVIAPGLNLVLTADPFLGRVHAWRLAVSRGHYDVVHWAGNFHLPLTGKRGMVLTVHDFMARHYESRGFAQGRSRLVQARLVEHSVRRASVVVVSGAADEGRVQDIAPGKRVVISPPGPGPWVRSEIPDHQVLAEPYVLLPGTDAPHKRMSWFLRRALHDRRFSSLHFRHTGKPLALGDERVRELGHLPASEMASQVASARCVVVPSSYEGYGMPVLESAVLGVPTVASSGVPSVDDASRHAIVWEAADDDLLDAVSDAVAAPRTVRTRAERAQLADQLWADHVSRSVEARDLARQGMLL